MPKKESMDNINELYWYNIKHLGKSLSIPTTHS